MKRAFILLGLLMVGPVWASDVIPVAKFEGWQGPKPAKPPCRCRTRDGSKVGLGAKTCVMRGENMVTLKCRLVLNNTSWQQVDEGCDVAMN